MMLKMAEARPWSRCGCGPAASADNGVIQGEPDRLLRWWQAAQHDHHRGRDGYAAVEALAGTAAVQGGIRLFALGVQHIELLGRRFDGSLIVLQRGLFDEQVYLGLLRPLHGGVAALSQLLEARVFVLREGEVGLCRFQIYAQVYRHFAGRRRALGIVRHAYFPLTMSQSALR
jgi:hypothetical protein